MKFQAQGLPIIKVYPHVIKCVIGPLLDKIGEHSITSNFDPQYYPKQPEPGHLSEFFFS